MTRFRQVVSLQPNYGPARLLLGSSLLALGKTQEAITQWNASMKAFKEQPPSDADPEEIGKVSDKLDAARVKLAQEKKR